MILRMNLLMEDIKMDIYNHKMLIIILFHKNMYLNKINKYLLKDLELC